MNKNFITNFLKGSAATSAGTVFSMVFHFASIMILTRNLPQKDFGIYILILATVHFINILSGLGLNLTLVRSIASDSSSEKKLVLMSIISTRIFCLSLATIIFLLTRQLLVKLFGSAFNEFLVYIPLLFFLGSFRDLFYNLLQGLNLFKRYAITQVTSAISRIGFILLAIELHKLSLINLVYIEIVTNVLTVTLQLIFIPTRLADFSFPKWAVYKNVLKFSIPLYFNNIVNIIIERINIFIIGAFLTPVSIAYYDVADKIPQAFRKMFQSFMIVYFPNISKLFSQQKTDDAHNFMNKSLVVFSTAITFILLICFLFREEIISLIFSKKYLPSANAFALLVLAFYFRVITNIMGNSLVAAGYSSVPVKANIVSSALGITASLLMIPTLGFIGAVYSTVIMNISSKLIHFLYAIKLKLHPNYKEYLKPAFIFAVIVPCYLFLNHHSLIVKAMWMLIFLAANWFLIEEVQKISKYIFKFSQDYHQS